MLSLVSNGATLQLDPYLVLDHIGVRLSSCMPIHAPNHHDINQIATFRWRPTAVVRQFRSR